MTGDRKEWVRISHSPTATLATVTIQDGTLTVKWTVKTYTTALAAGVAEARKGAQDALEALTAAMKELAA